MLIAKLKGQVRNYVNLCVRQLKTAQLYYVSKKDAEQQKEFFDKVQVYCMFIGYPRSGHSLIGALLNAHPDVVIGHEVNVLRFLQAGFSRNQLFSLILRKDHEFEQKGRQQFGYHYSVENQYQGKFRSLQVIGDKKGGRSALQLQDNPSIIEKLQTVLGLPLKVIHVIRNPYDNIATISKRKNISMQASMDFYFSLCEAVSELKRKSQKADIIDVYLESFIKDPKQELRQLCSKLGLNCSEDYLEDCSKIVFEAPRRSREHVTWDPGILEAVAQRSARVDFLTAYTFLD